MLQRTDNSIASIVTRIAVLVALVVTVALPVGHWLIAYNDFSRNLQFKSKVKATALEGLIATSPDTWMYAENRLLGLLAREPVALETESVMVYDDRDNVLAQFGAAPATPALRRSSPVFDATRMVGRVEVSDSLRGIVRGTAIAAALGLLLGAAVFATLRTFPLRAMRRATRALFQQKQHAEITLQSIADAVITTDAEARVDFLNPAAARLSGWSLEEAKGRPLTEVLRLVDTTGGEAIPTTLQQALSESRVVTFGRNVSLVRRDGTTLEIDDSAAPILDTDGKVAGGVMIFRDVSAAREFERQRSWEAAHDALTGLVNRREFESVVEGAVETARLAGKHHVVCYLDLDQFKTINDTCGHAAGDALLKDISGLLQSRSRAFAHPTSWPVWGEMSSGCCSSDAPWSVRSSWRRICLPRFATTAFSGNPRPTQ